MNDDSEEESGFLKKILANRKEDNNPVPTQGVSADKQKTESVDLDNLLKRIGMPSTDPGTHREPGTAPDSPAAGEVAGPDVTPEKAPAGDRLQELPQAGLPDLSDSEDFNTPIEEMQQAPPVPFVIPSVESGRVADAAKTKWSDNVTEQDEKIVSVDQLRNISGLILPKGATFVVDEVQLKSKTSIFARPDGTVPQEIESLWEAGLPSGGLSGISVSQLTEGATEEAKGGILDKFNLFKMIRHETEDYDPKIHGPVVDLDLRPRAGVEEIELYAVNEPFAYVRVIYDNNTHEYTYMVLEPVLSPAETDLFSELKDRIFERLDINSRDIVPEFAKKTLRKITDEIIADYGLSPTPIQRAKILYNMEKEFLGQSLIDPIMHDKYIEDISCDGVNSAIFVYHARFESMKTNLMFTNAEDLDSFVTKLAQRAGKYISIAEPMLDATMSDGSRIQMTLGQEVTAHGSTFTVRKFRDEPITPTDLIDWHTFSPLSIAFLWLAVETGKSLILAGGTASGKTTALNAIALFIPPLAKIVTLEDTRELKLPHPNWIPSITRQSFDSAGKGEIDMYELLRAALRQRPEYILVGEVRGKEAQTLFQAMSTGHVTYSTIHADSVASVVHRIENPPLDVPRNMLSALDLVCVQVQARVGGQRIRRNKQIIEILDIDPRTNELITNEVFKWRQATDEIQYSGKSFILEEIMEERGWTEERIREELKRRQEVLEWMRIKKIRHFRDVSNILVSYFRDSETVIQKVRADLYE
ncbi:MAG TPA: type II/IV secretion system ATPase subunit [Methanoregulaceae archaeon]|nr:type II/IV secretion system ATPase subunit [Methanoregulaceae archaeon]